MHRLAELLDPALRRMGVHRQVREAQLQETLDSLLGEVLRDLCQVVQLRRGCLTLATASTALAHQLQLDSPRLITSLNHGLGHPSVQRLRFVPLDRPAD